MQSGPGERSRARRHGGRAGCSSCSKGKDVRERKPGNKISHKPAVQPGAAARWARRRPTGCTPTPAPLGAAQVWVVGALGAWKPAGRRVRGSGFNGDLASDFSNVQAVPRIRLQCKVAPGSGRERAGMVCEQGAAHAVREKTFESANQATKLVTNLPCSQ